MSAAANVCVQCPACDTEITVPIVVEIVDTDDGQRMLCEPELADLWAHSWSCAE